MKKILYLLSVMLMGTMLGCSSPTSTPKPVTTPTADQKAESQAKINADNLKLKAEAVQSDFVEINGHFDQVKNKAVFAEGKVSVVENTYRIGMPKFLLSQKEGNGFGLYQVLN